MKFTPYPKTPRLRRELVITEKIDGTNCQVVITNHLHDAGPCNLEHAIAVIPQFGGDTVMRVGSRSRWITPGKTTDNYGFAQWCEANAQELFKLGEGHHFGEWYGQGIQRNYGMEDRRFALFNTRRWNEENKPACCEVVPIMGIGTDTNLVEKCLIELRQFGSSVPGGVGFPKPEGIIVFHTASRVSSKVTLEKDEVPKGMKQLEPA